MKKCTRCGIEKSVSEFQKRKASKDGLTASCKECLSKYDKSRAKLAHRVKAREEYHKTDNYKISHYEAVKKYRINNRDKFLANSKLKYAIKSGKIVKYKICSICGKTDCNIHGHHYDYSKPLDVVWCCEHCHAIIHGRCK